MSEDNEIDLPPKDWQSDRPKPREPFFGDGAPGAIAYIVAMLLTFTVVYFVTH